MEKINSKQIISIILVFAFIATSLPYADAKTATYAKLAPQSRTASPGFQKEFETGYSVKWTCLRLQMFANHRFLSRFLMTKWASSFPLRGLHITLNGPILKDRGIMEVIRNSRNELAIFEGPNNEYIFVLGSKNSAHEVIPRALETKFKLIGHNHPVDADTGFVQFMPSKGDLDTNEGRRLFIISPFGLTWYQAGEKGKHIVSEDIFKVFEAKKVGLHVSLIWYQILWNKVKRIVNKVLFKIFGVKKEGTKKEDPCFEEIIVQAAHTDPDTVIAFYRCMFVGVEFEPLDGIALKKDPSRSLFALAREAGFYNSKTDSIEELYGQLAVPAKASPKPAKAASYIEKEPEPDTFDEATRDSIKKGRMLIRIGQGDAVTPAEKKINRVIGTLLATYGWGLVGKVRSILVMPHLRGHSLSHLSRAKKIRIDARVVDGESHELLFDQIEHEYYHALLPEIDNNIGIQEMVAIFQSLKRYADPYWDDIDAIRELENGSLELSTTTSAYRGSFLESLTMIPGLDPEGLAAKLYQDTKNYKFDDLKDVKEIFNKIGEYIFYRKGYEGEQGALKQLRAERVDVVGRAVEALRGLNERRIRFILENRVINQINNWDDILRLRKLTHAFNGVQDVRGEINGRLDKVISEFTIVGISQEEKDALAFGISQKILHTGASLIEDIGSSVLIVKDAPAVSGVREVTREEVLTRLNSGALDTQQKDKLINLVVGQLLEIGNNYVFISDAAEAERRMKEVAANHGLDGTTFEKYRHAILLEFLYHNLFTGAILMRNINDIDKVKIIFKKKNRAEKPSGQVYKAILSANKKDGGKYAWEVELPVFLNEIWMLLDNCLIDIGKGAEENDIWRALEDLIEHAKPDPIGAYLSAREVKLDLREQGFMVIEGALLTANDKRRIEEINTTGEKIFIVPSQGFNAQDEFEALQAERKEANWKNTVFVVGNACTTNGIIQKNGTPNVSYFEAERGSGVDQMVRLANGLLEGVVSAPELLEVTKKLNPELYAEMNAAYGVPVLKSHKGDLLSDDIFSSQIFTRVMP